MPQPMNGRDASTNVLQYISRVAEPHEEDILVFTVGHIYCYTLVTCSRIL